MKAISLIAAGAVMVFVAVAVLAAACQQQQPPDPRIAALAERQAIDQLVAGDYPRALDASGRAGDDETRGAETAQLHNGRPDWVQLSERVERLEREVAELRAVTRDPMRQQA